jgi:hypothetical protein
MPEILLRRLRSSVRPAAAIINLSEPEIRDIFQQHHIPVFDAATDACFKMLRGYIDMADS